MITRRTFIRASAGAAGLAAAGAWLGSDLRAYATPLWQKLAKSLTGTLVLPGDPNYSIAIQLPWEQYDDHQPQAIAYCQNPGDVQKCIAFAQQNGVPVTARSGGHSYAGYSTNNGLVIDISRINAVTAGSSTVLVGAGANAVDVLGALTPYGIGLPAGLYPTVGIAGFVQGGGVGWDTRSSGLALDRLVSAQVVLANGQIVRCDTKNDPDLFWALRGGGGGNFGVVTQFESRPIYASPMVTYSLSWPWTAAAQLWSAWQNWIITSPNQLSSSLSVFVEDAGSGNPPELSLIGTYLGSQDAAQALLNKLTAAVGQAPTASALSKQSRFDTMMQQYGCGSITVPECQQEPAGQIQRIPYTYDRSRIFTKPMPNAGIESILDWCEQDPASGQSRTIWLLAVGGVANSVPADATAFVHRSAQYILSVRSGLPTGSPAPSDVAAAQAWTNQGFTIIDPYSSGESYQNFIDPRLPNWQQAYYGGNYSRLVQVKKAYDPDKFFSFAQSIG